jgi:hypothetical protein
MEPQDGTVGGTGDLDKFLGKHEDNAVKYLRIIEDLLADFETYGWAEDTLTGIWEYVDQNNSISEKQMQAVDNIREAGEKRRHWR